MKNAIILHGKPSKDKFYYPGFPCSSNYYWLPWLQKQLVVRDISCQTPEVPNNWLADYSIWRKEFERYDVTTETILIGHSCGAGFIVRWLSENKDVSVDKVFLVAPWTNPLKNENTGEFFDFAIDSELSKRADKIMMIYSNDDTESILKTTKILGENITGIDQLELKGQGHFYDERKLEFPELLQEIIR